MSHGLQLQSLWITPDASCKLARVFCSDVLLAGSRNKKLHFGRRAKLDASEVLLQDWTRAQKVLEDWWNADGREIFGESNSNKQTSRQEQMARKRAVFRLIANHAEQISDYNDGWRLPRAGFTTLISDTCLAFGPGTPQRGLSSDKMVLIPSDHGTMRSPPHQMALDRLGLQRLRALRPAGGREHP